MPNYLVCRHQVHSRSLRRATITVNQTRNIGLTKQVIPQMTRSLQISGRSIDLQGVNVVRSSLILLFVKNLSWSILQSRKLFGYFRFGENLSWSEVLMNTGYPDMLTYIKVAVSGRPSSWSGRFRGNCWAVCISQWNLTNVNFVVIFLKHF